MMNRAQFLAMKEKDKANSGMAPQASMMPHIPTAPAMPKPMGAPMPPLGVTTPHPVNAGMTAAPPTRFGRLRAAMGPKV